MAINWEFKDTDVMHVENYFHKRADQAENENIFLMHMYLAVKRLHNLLFRKKEVMYG